MCSMAEAKGRHAWFLPKEEETIKILKKISRKCDTGAET